MVAIIDPSWLQKKTPNLCIDSKTKEHRQGSSRKSKLIIAAEVLMDPKTKNYVVEMIGRELAKKEKVMASDGANSILQSQSPSYLKEFSWDMLLNEVSQSPLY